MTRNTLYIAWVILPDDTVIHSFMNQPRYENTNLESLRKHIKDICPVGTTVTLYATKTGCSARVISEYTIR